MRRTQTSLVRPFGLVSPPAPSTRNPLLQPFASSSPWNTSIGSSAVLGASGLGASPSTAPKLKTDEIFLGVNLTDPLLTLDDTNQANGNTVKPYDIAPGVTVHVPSGIAHGGKWNGIAAFLDVDGRHVWQGQPLYLRDGTVSSATDTGSKAGPRWAFTFPKPPNLADVYGDGLAGAHGGSHLGGFGGCLRAWEWNGSGNIKHALTLNVFSPKYLYRYGPDNLVGYRWPATTVDSTWKVQYKNGVLNNNYYGGSVSELKMGALLCLPASFDLTTVTDPKAARIAWTLQNYGCYAVDATGLNEFYSIGAETTVVDDIAAAGSAFHTQALALIPQLMVVTNNGPTAVGGGGTPRVAALPDIAP